MISVFDHSWLGGLFADDEVAALWSRDAQLGHFKAFESALALALEDAGRVSKGHGVAASRIIASADLDIDRLAQGTAVDGLPIPDFVRQLRADAGKAGDAIHTGATSQDVLDTALSLTLRRLNRILIARLRTLDARLLDLRTACGSAPLMARTRMQAALPILVSDRVDAWRLPLAAHIKALTNPARRVEQVQLGGAVGTRAAYGDKANQIVSNVAERLGLATGPVWHTDRTAVVDYAGQLAAISGSLGKIGQDIALMAQQGVDEITLSGGGGSSAMPHKCNPVLAELLVSLARFNATQVAGMHHALIHEQERSGAAWMLEWMILPPMTMTTARSLAAAKELCHQIERIGCAETV
jgi:3-carboxy-cis,cis-muconate cycloisomerase